MGFFFFGGDCPWTDPSYRSLCWSFQLFCHLHRGIWNLESNYCFRKPSVVAYSFFSNILTCNLHAFFSDMALSPWFSSACSHTEHGKDALSFHFLKLMSHICTKNQAESFRNFLKTLSWMKISKSIQFIFSWLDFWTKTSTIFLVHLLSLSLSLSSLYVNQRDKR